jgi:hypothetical protein
VARIIKELSESIGPRFSASDGEHAAAEVLRREFEEAGIESGLQRLSFVGWQATSTPTLDITAPEARTLTAAPVVYSAPAENLVGRVVPHGTRVLIKDLYEMGTFAILDDDDAPVAQLVVNPRGGAIPLINPSPLYRMPQLVISAEDAADIQQHLDEGEVRVRLNFTSDLIPDAYSYNVIGRYRGNPDTDKHIVVCAHYDTQIDSPGAYDNASGTAGMFGILEHLQDRALSVNVTFIGIAGEEVGMFGSHYYVNDLVERGILSDVRYCVCLDQISGGEYFWLWCTDPDLRAKGLAAIDAAGVAELGPVEVDDNKPGADHWAFHEQGVPACLLMWWRQADYHRSTDTFDKVDFHRVKVAVDAACHLVESLAAEL